MATEIWFSEVVQLFVLQSESSVIASCLFIEDMMWHSNSWFYYISALNLWFPCLWMKFWPIVLPWGGVKRLTEYTARKTSLWSLSLKGFCFYQHHSTWENEFVLAFMMGLSGTNPIYLHFCGLGLQKLQDFYGGDLNGLNIPL